MRADKIEHEIQLLVEGKDARNFFTALLAHMELVGVQVQNFGGVTELRSFLAAFVRAPNFSNVRSIGIVRDAEQSAGSAFQSVRDSLEHVNLAAPRHPDESTGESPSVRVLILPDNATPGMLETLLCSTLTQDPVTKCIDDFLQYAEESGQRLQVPDKARAHAWLATRPLPQVSVGVAAMKGYWNLDHQALDAVRKFLTAL